MDRKEPRPSDLRKRSHVFETKLRNMETVQRLTANSTGSHGFGGANAAMELQELKNGIKDAIRETALETIEERGPSGGTAALLEQANALRQLTTVHESQKNDISDLIRMVQVLTKEVRELRNANTAGRNKDDDKENDEPNTRTKREKCTWRDGMEFDKFWSWPKRNRYMKKLKAKDKAASKGVNDELKGLKFSHLLR